MCIGIPGKIVELDPNLPDMANVEVSGIRRRVNISLVAEAGNRHTLLNQWVLVHVGFAMNLLDEKEAQDTLEALQAMELVEEDVGLFLRGGR